MTLKEKIREILKSSDMALSEDDIAKILEINKKEKRILSDTLNQMKKDNSVLKDEKGNFKYINRERTFEGVLDMAEAGFGFVIVDGRDEDIFISRDDLNSALNGDRVLVTIKERRKGDRRDIGVINEVIERKTTKLVGTLEKNNKDDFGFVIPDDKKVNFDIFIKEKNIGDAKNGQKVYVKITKYPTGNKNPEGKITEVLGYPGEKGLDVLSIAYSHGIRMEFSKKVLKDAKYLEDEVSEDELEGRLDLRDKYIFTIDGADAKDLDDAISIEKLDNGNYYLGVHIADVTHYVKENSPIDNEARKRGTSVYLIDRVIPMLPKELSNGICSLHPDVDRLTLSVFMEVDKNGGVKSSNIVESVINSKARLIYDDVSNYLENGDDYLVKRYGEELTTQLDNARELMEILNRKRESKGAIDFDFAEGKIYLDKDAKVIDIKKEDRRVANRLIEEFMILANETVSETYFWMDVPFLYRIHEYPDEEKLNEFTNFARGLGYSIKLTQNEIHPRELQNLIRDVKGKKEEAVVSRMMLRSLKKARYSNVQDFHFGLASEYYSHFTSPIRRYPDLQIHRIIKENLNGKLNEGRIEHYSGILKEVADSSSVAERTAQEAERDVEKVKKAEYMEDHIGEQFEGIVSGITGFGIFVELPNTVEGLISYNILDDDFYIYDPEKMKAIGEKEGKEFNLGDKLIIEVINADAEKAIVDFKLVERV